MTRILVFIAVTLFTLNAFSQNDPTAEAQPIVEEGKRLYKSEMASWHGTDLFLEKYEDKDNIGGYFSYSDGDATRCIFISREEEPKVIGTIEFDSTFQVDEAKVNLDERTFSELEQTYYEVRMKAVELIQNDESGLFQFYKNTNLNIIPLINGDDKKVYVLTGPQNSGVVIFGNDYLITFDKDNNVTSKKALHKNIIPIHYGEEHTDGKKVVSAMHSHLPETGDFITATDICTLMLYSKYADWETHNVVSKKYLNIWNCETNSLIVLPMDVIKKIDKDQKKRKKKRERKKKKDKN